MKYLNHYYMTKKKSLLETDIFNYHTPEFFINMKNIPDKNSQERGAFISEEKRKCREGINVNGVTIVGSLYFHLNYYHLQGDDLTTGKKSVFLPRLRDNEWIFFNDYEEAYLKKQVYTFFGLRQAGKDLLDSSLLYQENGEITIGNCKVGDEIYDESGNLTKITGVFPQGKKPVYKMTLLDGREIFCGENHNWYVWKRKKSNGYLGNKKKNGKNPLGGYEVKTTKELLQDYKKERSDWVGKRKNIYEYNYGIPNAKVVKYSHKDQPIEPYLLGLWLGDGSNYYSKITTADKEIVDYLYEVSSRMGLYITKDEELTYMITAKSEGNKITKKNIFHNFLQDNKLYRNKHIPDIYLYGSEEQRLELLKGLMDSDGTCGKTGDISFSSSIPRLAEDFLKLCRSLGITASQTIKKSGYKKDGKYIECKNSYCTNLYTEKEVFKLKRKIDRCISKKKYLDFTSIINIEYVFDDYTTCITVDNDSHLFLTNDYTVTHNTEMEVSLCLREVSLFKETEAIALFSRSPDKDTFVKKISTAIDYGEKFIIIPNIDKDWGKEEIRFGIARADNTIDLRARLYIYNTQEGKKIQIGSGKTPSFMLMDEIAISPFRGVYDVLEPALLSDAGTLRCSPIFTFTGGEAEKAKDAEDFVKNPTNKQFKTILEGGREVGGRFLTGLYRKDCKKPTTLSSYINKKTNTWLDDYPIQVSDFELAAHKIEEEKIEASKSPDRKTFLLKRIFYPLNLEDVFLTQSNNNFPVEAARDVKKALLENYDPICVDFYRELDGKPNWKYSDLKPIMTYPVNPTEDKLAPCVMYEPVIKDLPYGTYVIGIDEFAEDSSSDKVNSLGSFCVFKRMHSPFEPFQDSIVLSYAGRPNTVREFAELVLMVTEYYGAIGIPENENKIVIQHFFVKQKAHLLADTLQLAKVISPTSKTERSKGLAATTPNQRYGMSRAYEYTKEEIDITDKYGNEIKVLGVQRIPDPMLLEEMIQYRGKSSASRGIHDINCDRIVSFYHALILKYYYDQEYPLDFTPRKDKENDTPKKRHIPTNVAFTGKSKNNFKTPPTWLARK